MEVLKMPTLLEPNAATYNVLPSLETAREVGVDRLRRLVGFGAGSGARL
jgi:hypothetical protein